MSIPTVERSAIALAMKEFDRELRATKDWKGWDSKKSQLYAISEGGALYPPKQIISMATGLSVRGFYGGHPTNSYLEERGFRIVRLPNERQASEYGEPPSFSLGKIYDRRTDIHLTFGGSWQSGIAPSSTVQAIFIFTGDSGEQYGYVDGRDELGVFSYTGAGQVGDMTFTRGNLAIRDHAEDGRALHLFKSLGKGKGQEYLGEHAYAGHSIRRGPDRNGDQRNVIVFQLFPVALLDDENSPSFDDESPAAAPSSLEEARRRAIEAFRGSQEATGKTALRRLYQRSKQVKDYVLLRAQGKCESCRQPAAFQRKDGSPYLEPHHTTRVSDGGLDHPRHVAAICPTCHRHIHHGLGGHQKNLDLIEAIAAKERDR
ncbi:HNH endonuclease [Cupriavidus sp. SK-3]|uniref:HNH endonuclease n=1 Tax=Cupriavidus sp. SK-3 TaxID=1470558 RepID=UPI00044C09F1|nr:HNH endonuclease signature motif containing protein [Cupriavidus sp. SK-3]KDP87819.1 HNH endonuclease [Cupriavidus sp. SK-3]